MFKMKASRFFELKSSTYFLKMHWTWNVKLPWLKIDLYFNIYLCAIANAKLFLGVCVYHNRKAALRCITCVPEIYCIDLFFFFFPQPQPAPAWTTFRVGLYCGVFIVLAVAFVLTGTVFNLVAHSDQHTNYTYWFLSYPVYKFQPCCYYTTH